MSERWQTRAIDLLLRIGVAFAFLYPPIAAWGDPYSWIGYFPPFLLDLAGANELVMLHAFGVAEIVIALWILSGRHIFYPSIAAALLLAGIVFFNWNQLDVIFRDIPILLASLALALKHLPPTAQPSQPLA